VVFFRYHYENRFDPFIGKYPSFRIQLSFLSLFSPLLEPFYKQFSLKCIDLVNTYRLIKKNVCHAHSNAHKPPKPLAPTIFMLENNFNWYVNTYRLAPKNIYIWLGRKRFLLPATYFPTNLLYPFTLRVIKRRVWRVYI